MRKVKAGDLYEITEQSRRSKFNFTVDILEHNGLFRELRTVAFNAGTFEAESVDSILFSGVSVHDVCETLRYLGYEVTRIFDAQTDEVTKLEISWEQE